MIGGFQVGPFQTNFQQQTGYRNIFTEISAVVNAPLIVQPTVEWIRSSTIPYAGVVTVNPPSGTVTNPFAVITLQASLGPPNSQDSVTVPNVVGEQAYLGKVACANAGLLVDNYVYVNTNGVTPALYIISQSLTAGSVVTFGTLITLTVSIG